MSVKELDKSSVHCWLYVCGTCVWQASWKLRSPQLWHQHVVCMTETRHPFLAMWGWLVGKSVNKATHQL